MKKKFPLVLIAIILLIALKTCSSELFMSSEKLIAKGDEALANNDLDKALSYYNQAGPEGDEKEKNVLKQKINTILNKNSYVLSNQENTNVKEALKFLEEEAKYTFEEEERYIFLLECIQERIEGILTDADSDAIYDAGNLLEAVESVFPAETPGLKEYLNSTYFTLGYSRLLNEVSDPSGYSSVTRDALWYWTRCTEGPGYECSEAINQTIPQQNYEEGFTVLKEYITDNEVLILICNDLRENISYTTVSELFAFEATYYSMFPREEADPSLIGAFSGLNDLRLGNNHQTESIILSVAELQAACGLNPGGRVLFLHKPHEYDDNIGLYLPLMDLLPNAYYPDSLESVEYVVFMSCESVMTGATFENGTEEMREDTTVTLYDTKTGEILYQATKEGPTSFIMTYYGDTPPSVYSAGAPYIGSLVLEAITHIETTINQ